MCVRWDEKMCGNPVIIFPIKKRIVFDRIPALYIGEIWFKLATNEGDQPVGTSWLEEQMYLNCAEILLSKGKGMKDQMWTYLEMSLMVLCEKGKKLRLKYHES